MIDETVVGGTDDCPGNLERVAEFAILRALNGHSFFVNDA